MNFDLDKHTVFITLGGSQAYGIATPQSDYDYRGIVIAPRSNYVGLKNKFETASGREIYKNFPVGFFQGDPRVGPTTIEEPDLQFYELRKFVLLAIDNNPSVLEILFTDESDILRRHPILDRLIENRDKLISKASKYRFCGYAFQQLKRIQRHKRWLDNPIENKPKRSDFGLPDVGLLSADQMGAADAILQDAANGFAVNQDYLTEDAKIELRSNMYSSLKLAWKSISKEKFPICDDGTFGTIEDSIKLGAAIHKGFDENFIEVLKREKLYRAAKNDYDAYQKWKSDRNEKRAEIEKEFGFDLKHATHLIRLLKMSREILTTGKVIVKRPDAEELLEIRNGKWSYEKIVEFAETEDSELEELLKKTTLPHRASLDFFDDIVQDIIERFRV
jgi:predicted nucleotidyltransferase